MIYFEDILKNISTKELVEELKKRTGVQVINLDPYEKWSYEIVGPAIILTVID